MAPYLERDERPASVAASYEVKSMKKRDKSVESVVLRIEDEKGHRAMQAAAKAWNAIRASTVRARTEAQTLAGTNEPVGSKYNKKMGELLQAYGFGNAVERFRSKVTRADLLHCMDYLTEIEKWRQDAKASVLPDVERDQKHDYPDYATLNHPTVVWRRFKASADGKQAFKDRGIEPKARAPKQTDDDVKRERDEFRARNEELQEELKAARSTAADPAAEPTATVVPAAVAIAEAVTKDIQLARGNYVALLPDDREARREELVAIIGAATKGWSDQDKIKACLAITHHIRDATSASRA
jgi:hypothetical protein